MLRVNMKLAPSLHQAYQRRYWLLASSVLENILFSAVLLGWPALVAVLKREGYYAQLCSGAESSLVLNSPNILGLSGNGSYLKLEEFSVPVPYIDGPALIQSSQSSRQGIFIVGDKLTPAIGLKPTELGGDDSCCSLELQGCPAQERKLNLCFTVGTFLLSALILPIGVALDRFGPRFLRILGGIMVGVSAVMFACSSAAKPDILFFASALNGVGGSTVMYTSLQVANLFGSSRPMALGLLIGSYSAAATLFPTLKVLYALGVPIQLLFFGLAFTTLLLIINCIFNIPNEAIVLGKVDLTRLVENATATTRFYSSIQRPAGYSVTDLKSAAVPENGKEMQSPESEADVRLSADGAVIMPLHRVVFMPLYLWSVLVISITQLRLLFFIGDLHQSLVQIAQGNTETIDLYIFIFGILQVCGLGTTHFIGGFVDWRNKGKCDAAEEDGATKTARHISKPIPASSTTVSLVVDKETPDTVPATPCSVGECCANRQPHHIPVVPTPPISASLPVTPDVAAVHYSRQSTISASTSETAFNTRKPVVAPAPNGKGDSLASRYTPLTSAPTPTAADSTVANPAKQALSTSSATVHSGTRELDHKIRKLKDCSVMFFVNSALMVMFGLLVLIPNLTIQVSTFVCYTLIRGFVPCAVGRLYSIAFHPSHHQTLVGLAFLLSAIISVLQYPLFFTVVGYLNGDSYWVNMGLLVTSLLCFLLPTHLLFHCRHLEEWRKMTNMPPQPVIIKMQYLDTKVTGKGMPAEL